MGIIKNGMVLLNVPALSEGLVHWSAINFGISRHNKSQEKRDEKYRDNIIGNRMLLLSLLLLFCGVISDCSRFSKPL